MRRLPLALIGPGAAGSALVQALRDVGWPIVGVVGRTPARARAAAARLDLPGLGTIARPAPGFAAARIVLIAVRDQDLGAVAAEAAQALEWRDRIALHLAGALPATVLSPLSREGAAVGSFHPLMTFVARGNGGLPRDTPVFLEGDSRALVTGRTLARALGLEALELDAASKTLYHAAATIAGNLVTTLLAAGSEVLAEAGIRDGARLLAPLARESVRNAAGLGPARALTGPVARGDAATLAAHSLALSEAGLSPTLRTAHAAVSLLAADLAESEGRDVTEVRSVLEAALRTALGYTGARRRKTNRKRSR